MQIKLSIKKTHEDPSKNYIARVDLINPVQNVWFVNTGV